MAARDALLVLNVFFLFQYQPKGDPAKRSAFGKEEGASGYGVFAAPAEAEWSWLLLTPRRFFSFLERERKEWGRKKRADEYPQGAGRICNAPSPRTAALGIGPYKDSRKIHGIATPVCALVRNDASILDVQPAKGSFAGCVLLCKSIAKSGMCHFLAPAGQPEMMHKNFMHRHLHIFVMQRSCMKFYAFRR